VISASAPLQPALSRASPSGSFARRNVPPSEASPCASRGAGGAAGTDARDPIASAAPLVGVGDAEEE
jgi:hypothetical protein